MSSPATSKSVIVDRQLKLSQLGVSTACLYVQLNTN